MKKLLLAALGLTAIFSLALAKGLTEAPSDSYRVGVAYHATTEDFVNTAFIKNYHSPAVRNLVLSQLEAMAKTTADTISTALWFVSDPGSTDPQSQLSWRLHFPPTEQELDNIEQYAMDVKNILTKSGRPLELHIRLAWLGCADFNVVNPDGTYGFCHYSWEQLISSTELTIDNVLLKVADHASYVDVVGDTWHSSIPSHQDWFIEIYPYFLERALEKNIEGGFHSSVPKDDIILDPNYNDPLYPEINGHGAVRNIYRMVKFIEDNHLELPEIFNFSYYPLDNNSVNYDLVAQKTVTDFRAIFGKDVRLQIGESHYSDNPLTRREMGYALAKEARERGNIEQVIFWTTPNAGLGGEEYAPPFGFDEYSLGSVYVERGSTANEATVSWEFPDGYIAQVWVNNSLLGCSVGGAEVSVNWIQPNTDYLFRLYPALTCTPQGRTDYQVDSFLYRI